MTFGFSDVILLASRKNAKRKEYSMSNFWDSIIFPNKAEVVAVKKTDFWASILGGELVRPLPVKQSKPKAVKSTAKKGKAVVVAEAEKVYETIANLIVPSSECVHYWTLPTGSKWAIVYNSAQDSIEESE